VEEDIRNKYIGKSARKYFPEGSRNPIWYVNCQLELSIYCLVLKSNFYPNVDDLRYKLPVTETQVEERGQASSRLPRNQSTHRFESPEGCNPFGTECKGVSPLESSATRCWKIQSRWTTARA